MSTNLGLLNAISAKLDYLSRRQEIVAQNIANADTPNYRPQDVTDIDFGALMGAGAFGEKLRLATPNDKHLLSGGVMPGQSKEIQQKTTYEVAPAGNAVILEEQLTKASTTKMDYDLMVNLYQKNINMLRIALGQGR